MPTYYVSSPDLNMSAEVSADTKRHAETAFTQYLARNNYIQHGSVGFIKDRFQSSRMEPGEIRTDVQLVYDLSNGLAVQRTGGPIIPIEEVDFDSSIDNFDKGVRESLSVVGSTVPSPVVSRESVPPPTPRPRQFDTRGGVEPVLLEAELGAPMRTAGESGLRSEPVLKIDPIEEARRSPIGQVALTLGKINPQLQRGGL